jgi:hypothetical protein
MRARTDKVACSECGRAFTPRCSTARFCSSSCRLRRHRASRPAMPARATENADVESVSVSGHPHRRQNGIRETLTPSRSRPLPRGIVPHSNWPGMYRVKTADGTLSDMLNLTRARDLLRTMEDAAA